MRWPDETQQNQFAKAWCNGLVILSIPVILYIIYLNYQMVLILGAIFLLPAGIGMTSNRIRKGKWLTW